MELKRVVVTGLGALTPLGNSVDETWKNLLDGVSGADFITHYDASGLKTKFACELKNFNATDHFDRKELRKLDPFAQYAIVAADQAVADSGIDAEAIDHDRVGVIWGAGIGGLFTFQEEVAAWQKSDRADTHRFSPFFIPKMIADIAPGNISMKYGFRGPNFGVMSACASSTNAIIDAFNYIRLGKADAIVSGGSEATIFGSGMGGFISAQALSSRNEDPKTASRPFCNKRDGFVMGEGGVSLILEEYEHAKARGAKIYAEVVGGGMSADAHHLTAPHPEGLGATNVMKSAIADAEITANDIDYVNVHGTATPRGDVAELKAIEKVFGDHAYDINISSTKSMTGHLLGAAGALEATIAVLSVKNDVVPPTINHEEADPNIDPKLNLTLHTKQERIVNYALSNTFGFGGHNASVIVKKFSE